MTSCRKRCFSKLNAKIVLMKMQSKDKGAKRIYYCVQHKAWHITSQVKRSEIRDSTKKNTSIDSGQKGET